MDVCARSTCFQSSLWIECGSGALITSILKFADNYITILVAFFCLWQDKQMDPNVVTYASLIKSYASVGDELGAEEVGIHWKDLQHFLGNAVLQD